LKWNLEYANNNGTEIYQTIAAVKRVLETLKKGSTRELAKKVLEHLDKLSRTATSDVSSRVVSRSPSH
jgi:hypothetical protein